ncbi:MarR family winged helix-turn-helix transcriptional regulator [Chloroflexota bacterium]
MITISNNHPDYVLWLLLPQATDSVLKARETELREFGLTRAKAAVLFILSLSQEAPTPSDIAHFVFREPHTISSLLDRMQKQDLILKVRDAGKKRQYRVYITDKGTQLYNKAKKMTSIRSIFSIFTKDEKNLLTEYLKNLRNKALSELAVAPKISFP